MHANKPGMARRWERHTPKGRRLPQRIEGKYETTTAEGLDEMSPGQADAWAESHVNFPELPDHTDIDYTETFVGKYFEHLCGKCGGIKRDRMVGKLTLIGKDCGCPKTHGRKGVVEFQKEGQLPIIGKWEDTKRVIGKLTYATPAGPVTAPKKGHLHGSRWGKMRGDMEAVEPAGPEGPAPFRRMVGKQHFNGVSGIDHIDGEFKRFLPTIRTEKLEDHAQGSPDVRVSIEDVNYTQSTHNFSEMKCRNCDHSHEAFVINSHGFMVTGARCSALKDDPMVSKDARCDLWVGSMFKGAPPYFVPSNRLVKKQAQAGPFIGPRGGRWADARHTIPWRPMKEPKGGRRNVMRRLMAKTRRRESGKGGEVSLTKQELHLVLSSGKYALVSAGKNPRLEPNMSASAERQRHAKLRQRLASDGFMFTKVEGHYEGAEDSFLVMVHDASRGSLRQIGKEFNQGSIVYGEGGKQEMHFTTGEHADKNECHAGKGYEEKPEAQDYYTRFPHPDGSSTKFALNFDFGSMVPCKKSMVHTLRKGGPYIGPRGGKWADPKHTIPWKERKGRKRSRKEQERFERVKRTWIDKWVGKPGESAAAEGVLLKHYGEAVRHVLDGTPLSKEAEEHQVRNFGKNWRADAKMIYEDTQRKLAEHGIKTAKLFRGVSHHQTHSHNLPAGGSDMELGVYSLSSWTTNTEAAKFFAGWKNPPPPSQWGRVVVSEVDAKHIFLDHRVEPRLHAAGEREVILAPPIPPGDRIRAKAFGKQDKADLEKHLKKKGRGLTLGQLAQMRSAEVGRELEREREQRRMRGYASKRAPDFHVDDNHQMWLREVREKRGSDLRKSWDGGGPQNYHQQVSMPDFQEIYHQPEDSEQPKREREAAENRRRSMADKNKGKYGFHGEPPEPQLRAEPLDYVPATQYGDRRLTDRPPKPRFIPPRIFAKMRLPIIRDEKRKKKRS